ncbi:MAG: hypothetical protein V7K98_02980 [Nostoc sp.]|uniref:hypothetical protein n=1 Tax=Nostoc sp. TaxID=1180 RepID=UPI002FF80FB1
MGHGAWEMKKNNVLLIPLSPHTPYPFYYLCFSFFPTGVESGDRWDKPRIFIMPNSQFPMPSRQSSSKRLRYSG